MSDSIKAFEDWAKTKGKFKPLDFLIACDGRYSGDQLQSSFNGWQASRQALEGEPVGTARRCEYDRDITYCEFEADEVPICTKLYTHPASAEVERLQARLAEKCDAPVGWIDPKKYRAACESKMEFFKTIKELREQNEKLQARVAELESDEQEMAGDNNV